MLGIWRKWRRRRLTRRGIPAKWQSILDDLTFVRDLSDRDKKKLISDLIVFVHEKNWVGLEDFVVTDEVKVTIAASAVRLIVNLDIDHYSDLVSIYVFEGDFRSRERAGEAEEERDHSVFHGIASSRGQVVLSWKNVKWGLSRPHDGHDVAIHEFAHVLDIHGGDFDGTPSLRKFGHYGRWAQVMSKYYLQTRGEGSPVLDYYAATNEAEFFAVASEAFFEKPRSLRKYKPDVYTELSRFYGMDPAAE